MSDKHSKQEQENEELQDNTASTGEKGLDQEQTATTEEGAELAEMKDKYIRLMAEFENFRRRTAKERLELSRTATQDLMSELLPVLDDMERARQAMEETKEVEAMQQGLELVFHKMKSVVQQKGLKAIEINPGDEFDSDFHEAVTQIPAPSDDLKGKIVDVIEKGYILNDKVIRYAKVIIGA